eukprot:145849_1
MLLLLVISLIILSVTLLLHYHQHFHIHNISPCTAKQSTPSVMNKDMKDDAPPLDRNGSFCLCALRPRYEEDTYDFFPASFLYYLLFTIVLCALIITVDITDYYVTHDTLHYDILFDYSVQSFHRLGGDKKLLFTLQSIHLSNIETSKSTGWAGLFIKISDYILIHSVMLMVVWESLFSFYKYYTTNVILRLSNGETISTQVLASKFMVYGATFALLFVAQMHFYYYLWPILFLSHCVFNLVCTLTFSSVLIKKYRMFIAMEGGLQNVDNRTILNSIYTMRAISVTCIALQSIYLGLFTISYTVNTVYYLPILWSINACVYSLNFVRNRRYLSFKYFEMKQKFKYKAKTVKPFTNDTTKPLEITQKHFSELNHGETKVTRTRFSTVIVNVKSFSIDTACEVENEPKRASNTASSTMSEAGGIHDQVPPSLPLQLRPNHVRHNHMRSVALNTKALKLLGIASGSIRRPVASNSCILKKTIVHSQSDVVFSAPSSNQIVCSNTAPLSDKTSIEKRARLQSNESITTDEPKMMDYIPTLPLRRISSPSLPREFIEKRASMNPNITIEIKNIEFIDSAEEIEDPDCDDSCVFLDYDVENIDNHFAREVDVAVKTRDPKKRVNEPKPTWLCHPRLSHRKSSSDPMHGMNDNSLNLNEMMESLDLFAKYGFCSRSSINSLYQLAKYRNKG